MYLLSLPFGALHIRLSLNNVQINFALMQMQYNPPLFTSER